MQFRRPLFWFAVGGILLAGLTLLAVYNNVAGTGNSARASVRVLQIESGGELRVHWNETSGVPDFLVGSLPEQNSVGSANPMAAAISALDSYSDTFQIDTAEREFSFRLVEVDKLGQTHVCLDQIHQGVPVWARDMVVHFDPKDGLLGFSGEYAPGLEIPSIPRIAASTATGTALDELVTENPRLDAAPELKIYIGEDGQELLTWFIPIAIGTGERLGYFIDAQRGTVAHVTPLSAHRLERFVYDAELKESLPGRLIAVEGEVPRDAAGQSVYQFMGGIYNYFSDVHGRDSFDNRGAQIVTVVHSATLGNSYCNGELLVFGDQDDFMTNKSDALVDDIAAHEFVHAVTQYTAGLIYEGQSGALNEHFSDTFAVMIDREDYQLFEDNSLSPPIPKPWLRDMIDPSLGTTTIRIIRIIRFKVGDRPPRWTSSPTCK